MDGLAKLTGGGTAQWAFLMGLCLMIFILLTRSRKYFRQVARHQQALSPAARTAKSGGVAGKKPPIVAGPPKQVEQWEVAMHELARDLSGQLDSKIRILEMLIREANQTAARLDSALEQARQARPTPRDDVATVAPAGTSTGSTRRAEPRRVEPQRNEAQRSELQRTELQRAQPSNAASRKSAPVQPSADWPENIPSGAPPNPRFERIYALSDAGLSPTTIANQIGSQLGEVELILSLRGPQPAE